MGPKWSCYVCPQCRRVHEFPEGVIAYICGCGKSVSLDCEPETDSDDGEWYGDWSGNED